MNIINQFKDKIVGFFDNHFTKRGSFTGDPNLLDETYPINRKDAPNNITSEIIRVANLSETDVLNQFDTTADGLHSEQIEHIRSKYGMNQIEAQHSMPWYCHLWNSYKNPFNLLLTILAIVSYLTDDIRGTTVIASMVIISTILRFVQEQRSTNAANELKKMVSTTATVLRADNHSNALLKQRVSAPNSFYCISSTRQEIPISELLPGDIITLSAGDMIPADVRILTAKDLFVSQAALTGESLPVEKYSKQMYIGEDPLEMTNIGFMGTNVVSGAALCLVVATAKNTFFGALADKLIKQEVVTTSFQKGINKVSWLLIYFMMVMSPIVFLINGITKHDWINAAFFALSIAVGLTPEMLPMIVTSTLAKGAVAMSRRKAIVKRLDAIQNFGAMDILCTDKTGTLTQDRICLERHTDIFGNDFDDVLEYAYLNSYYQTGLKNLLDIAVLDQSSFGDIPQLVDHYKKVDEVPFDFERRRMSVVVSDKNNKHLLICKGAVEEMLHNCSGAYHDNMILPFTKELLLQLKQVTEDLNRDGLRVVAVATKKYEMPKLTYGINDEKDMVLVGYIAFLDPPKETTMPAIKALSSLGVSVKILTGDNELVTAKVCKDVGLDISGMMLGNQLDSFTDDALMEKIDNINVFAKLTPSHKERIVKLLRDKGHTVGFMGDGINDAPALRAADVGISVDTAVDIAKEAADIILLEKSLMVLERGVEEGRKTFANMLKYIKMTASSNFGNVFSVLIASAFIPFMPMLPIHLLVLNLLYDVSQIAIPFDNVDQEFIHKPQKWDSADLRRFMIFFGPISSIFDILTFMLMWHVFGANVASQATLFQTGWFVESLITQILIVHMIRTRKIPFIQSRAAWVLVMMSLLIISIGIYIPMGSWSHYFSMIELPNSFFMYLMLIIMGYMILTQLLKGVYARKFGWQ